jgi:hypothetical protein
MSSPPYDTPADGRDEAAPRPKAKADYAAPPVRTLKVYALDPSAGNYIGNVMSVKIKWENDLKHGPVGSKLAVVDYDGANKQYYPPIDLNDPYILARGGLDPSESDPRFHQQMVYAVAAETLERFETALGRDIHWRRPDYVGDDACWRRTDKILVLRLFPHAMVQANAFYSPEAKGILFGYFPAQQTDQGRNLPGQRVFTCLSHDIIAHEMTHAIIDGIRTNFTEPTNPDVLAFHEGFADLAALFSHFSHKSALIDTIQKTGGRLYQFELKPDAAPAYTGSAGRRAGARGKKKDSDGDEEGGDGGDRDGSGALITGEMSSRNPLIDLAQQFGEASGMNRGLRSALDVPPNTNDINRRVNDAHFRGSILVAAVFDAFFSVYIKRTRDLFRIFRAGGGSSNPEELPTSLAEQLARQASETAAEFFQMCARALDYCPPVDVTFGDFLRALITVNIDLKAEDGSVIRDALMQAFRVRGIYPEGASFFSEDALCWPCVPKWSEPPGEDSLPPVKGLVFGSANGLTKDEKDNNGKILRKYARDNAERLGFDPDPSLPDGGLPQAPSFHPVFRIAPDGRLRVDMVVELVQTRKALYDAEDPSRGSFPLRGGVTLIISAPEIVGKEASDPEVRFAIRKPLKGKKGKDGVSEGERREARQREYYASLGLLDGGTEDPKHFQVNFGLLHQGF